MKLIDRDDYLSKLIEAMGTPDIKVVTGIRRCGKSKLLEAFIDHVTQNVPDANVIHVNFNLVSFEGLLEYHALLEFVEAHYLPDLHNFLIIDEVQMCKGFEKALNSLHAQERYDIYITGSNAFLMSSDLATLFTGRTYEIEVHPFSFSEFVRYYELPDLDAAFDRYVTEGGMSGSYVYSSPEAKSRYLCDVYDTLIMRDIRQKHSIRNVDQLERASNYLMDNISNISSAKSIADSLAKGGLRTSDKTVGAYLSYLCEAFAFYRVRRYDIRGKRYLTSGDKFYLADHSFRYAKLGTRNMDYGRTYENIVAMELIRRGYEVYAGTLYQKEIDFVAMKQNEKLYIQVSDDISSTATFTREIGPLLQIRDAFPKMVIARTKHGVSSYEGVEIVDIARWLLGEE